MGAGKGDMCLPLTPLPTILTFYDLTRSGPIARPIFFRLKKRGKTAERRRILMPSRNKGSFIFSYRLSLHDYTTISYLLYQMFYRDEDFDAKSGCFQYFSPYLSADMNKMATAFNTTVPALEDELMQLILEGQINARIDSHNKVWAILADETTSLLKCHPS